MSMLDSAVVDTTRLPGEIYRGSEERQRMDYDCMLLPRLRSNFCMRRLFDLFHLHFFALAKY
jgi:hypothetical protein